MRILFALPGLHRYDRGAEIAFISIARALVQSGNRVTLIGSGNDRPTEPYGFLHAASVRRERFETFPSMPALRNEYGYEEFTFVPDLLRRYHPSGYDVTVTCGYPFTNWVLRRPTLGGSRPPHVFVTQNGDWPAHARNSEFRFFGCEGLVCTNPDFYERNRAQWNCRLIPNGVDCNLFRSGAPERRLFGLPAGRLIVLMVSALIATKRVGDGIEAVSRISEAHLVVAGDGPLRQEIEAKAASALPGRFTRVSIAPERMPSLYRSANVFLHLSKEEAFGNVFLEASACGLPIVGHDTRRLRWILGDEGFLLDTEDLDAVARQIELARDDSPAKVAERIAKAETFSWTRIGEMYQDFLRDVIASCKSGHRTRSVA